MESDMAVPKELESNPDFLTASKTNSTKPTPVKKVTKKLIKSASFTTPKDIILFGQKITNGDNDWVKASIERNPRYLANDAGRPTILQAGARYNALHMAARSGNADAAAMVLSVISSPQFMDWLHPYDTESFKMEKTRYLTDMFLNTPDKHSLDTPLHFACKINALEVVKVLIAHPLCDLTRKNWDGRIAENVIGERSSGNEDALEISRQIRRVFQETMIVPIWRDRSGQTQPVVGLPVDPKRLGIFTPSLFHEQFEDIDLDTFGPVVEYRTPFPSFGIPKYIKAFAGPMDADTAQEFYNQMKRSGGALQYNSLSLDDSFSSTLNILTSPPRNQLPITESGIGNYCPTPGTPFDFGTDSGSPFVKPMTSTPLQAPMVENMQVCSPAAASLLRLPLTPIPFLVASPFQNDKPRSFSINIVEEKRIRLQDLEKGVERVGRRYAKGLGVPFYEWWNFACKFLDIRSLEGLVELENWLLKMERTVETYAALGHHTPEISTDENKCKLNGQNTTPCGQFTEYRDKNSSNDESESVDSDESPPKKRRKLVRRCKLFHTAQSSPNDEFHDCRCGSFAFVEGVNPSKEDFQLQAAIADVATDLVLENFKAIPRWFNGVKALGADYPKQFKL